MNNQPVRIIGKYPIINQLARSSQHATFISKSPTTNANTVIKMYPNKLLLSQSFKAQFMGEMRQLKALNHAHITPIIEYGFLDDKFPFFEIPYVGMSLEALIQQGIQHNYVKNGSLLIFQAMIYAHHQGGVHGNLKPSNILFDNENKPYLADFRFACVDQHIPYVPTLYSAPEQVDNHRTDEKSDIYSLGLVLFAWLTGQDPIWSEAFPFSENRILPPIADYYPDCPPLLDAVIQQATAPNPDDRYNTMREFSYEYLKAWREGTNSQSVKRVHPLYISDPFDSPPISKWDSKLQPANKNKSIVMGCLGTALMIIAIIVIGVIVRVSAIIYEDNANPNNDYVYSPAPIPEGYVLYRGDNVEMAIPSTWADINSPEFAQSRDESLESLEGYVSPEFYSYMIQNRSQLLSNQHTISAMDFNSSSNVIVSISNSRYTPPTQVIDMTNTESDRLGIEILEATVIQLPVGETVYIRASLPINQPYTIVSHLYIFQLKGKVYTITFTEFNPLDTEIMRVMLDTFRVNS